MSQNDSESLSKEMEKTKKNGWVFGLSKSKALTIAGCDGPKNKKSRIAKVWKGPDGTFAASEIAGNNPH